MENRIGVKKIENKYEKVFKNSAVKISSGAQQAMGILEKVEGYTFYLNPALVYQNLAADRQFDWEYHPIIKSDRPVMFEVSPPFVIEPVSKEYLEELVKSYEKWKIRSEDKSKLSKTL